MRRTSRGRRRQPGDKVVLGLLGGVAAALAAAAAKVALRRRAAPSASTRGPRPDAGAPPSDQPAKSVVEQTWKCECGQGYRTSGEGRHKVFWPADASVSDPVLSGRCVSCDKPLPEQHAAVADA